ncbi:MAG: ATP-dependent DNA helicase RecG [bacterium]|nr:ATP-dependent DNA helicase RecG [bacterium]
MINLNTKVEDVPKIGPAYQKKLKKFGIKTIQDLLYYFPARYDDFSNIIPINEVKAGNDVCIQGRIVELESSMTFQKEIDITEILVEDDTGQIKALWFNQPYMAKSLKEDDYICLAGKVSLSKHGMYLNNPAHERMNEFTQNSNLTHTGRIIPVYNETKGLTSRWLRYIIKPLLSHFYRELPEILPEEILKKYKFLPLQQAIWQAHFPDSFEYADAAKSRFSFEELFLLQLSVLKEKAKLLQNKAPACPMDAKLMKTFTDSLPFQLTDSQKQCSWQVLKDLEKDAPMSRLLEGDVGSGKTIVATMATLNTVKCGYQAAFMAPTEILASQHFKGLSELLKNFNVSIGFLTGKEAKLFKGGSVSEITKKNLLLELEFGQVDILIGTHSLIQKTVVFSKLALVVLDEQHRFGVGQRAALTKGKKLVPHLLSMTATPIPRTLALTVYGDLDLSLIKEMPKNRKKIKTVVVEPAGRKTAYEFIEKEVKEGKGVFVICPKIEGKNAKSAGPVSGSAGFNNAGGFVPQNYDLNLSAKIETKSVTEEYERLSKEIFPDLRITMLHGKMKAGEKEKIMTDFKKGEIDILVSTSVIEVGIDVPRATIMMIEGAERFGLAQLHQFRGRVGRSDMQSYCFLFTTSPDQLNRERLKAMVDSNNGFELAQKDLEIRGPGQLYGTQQWGLPDIAMQGLSNIFLVEKTRQAAKEILEKDLTLETYPLLKERVKQFKTRIHFE